MAEQVVERGDQVSWQWSGTNPQGDVANVANVAIHGQVSVENDITKTAEPEDAAVQSEQPNNDAVKNASDAETKAPTTTTDANGENKEEQAEPVKDPEKEDEPAHEPASEQPAAPQENGEAKTGEKRDHDAVEESEAQNGEKEAQPDAAASIDAAGTDDAGTDAAVADAVTQEQPPKKQKTDDSAENAVDASNAKKATGRLKKSQANGEHKEKKAPAKKRAPKKAATETGEPRRSARIRS